MRKTPRAVLAVCALLATAACGLSAAGDQGELGAPIATSPATRYPVTPEGTVAKFGSDYRFHSGLVVTVSAPKSFTPSESAYPQSSRAAAFGIAIYNTGDAPYQLSKLSVSATVDDRPATQVVDATQGYNGIVEADQDVQPGKTVRFVLAFAVLPETTPMKVCVRPDPSTTRTAMYRGPV